MGKIMYLCRLICVRSEKQKLEKQKSESLRNKKWKRKRLQWKPKAKK